LRPKKVPLDTRSLLGPGGVVLGRSEKLKLPRGARVEPDPGDVAAVDGALSPDKVLSRKHLRLTATAEPAAGGPGRTGGLPPAPAPTLAEGEGAVDLAVWVEDLGSTNGTYVDGELLAPNTKVRLRHGAQIQLGLQGFRVVYKFEDLRRARSSPSPCSVLN